MTSAGIARFVTPFAVETRPPLARPLGQTYPRGGLAAGDLPTGDTEYLDRGDRPPSPARPLQGEGQIKKSPGRPKAADRGSFLARRGTRKRPFTLRRLGYQRTKMSLSVVIEIEVATPAISKPANRGRNRTARPCGYWPILTPSGRF